MIFQHGLDQYQSVELGYGFDDVHHLLLAHFDQLTVVLFGGQRFGTRPGHPVVLLDGRQRDPGVRVLVQEPVQQVNQLWRGFRVTRPLHWLRPNLVVDGQHGVRVVRQSAVNERVQGTPQRPDVQRFTAIRSGRRVQHFGSRKRGRTGTRTQQVVAAVKLVAHAQVGDFHVAVCVDQQVGRFNVPVYDPLEVHCVRITRYTVTK